MAAPAPPPAKAGLWAENAEDEEVDAEATGVPGEEEAEPGEEDLSCSMNEADEDSRSFEGIFDWDPATGNGGVCDIPCISGSVLTRATGEPISIP